MGENSAIEWTDHTFNPWWGCAKVSPGCDNCYAERDSTRYGHRELWGVDANRRTLSDQNWNTPRKWDRKAAQEGRRARVFCASMADVFDKNAPEGARKRLLALIRETPNLDWLLLTKRIGNAKTMLPSDWGDGYANVWLGMSIVNGDEWERDAEKLRKTPARVRFVSFEPLLGLVSPILRGIDWIIVGGESGPKSRPMQPGWADMLLRCARQHGVAFFMKQGSQANWPRFKDIESFPPALRVREWPSLARNTQ